MEGIQGQFQDTILVSILWDEEYIENLDLELSFDKELKEGETTEIKEVSKIEEDTVVIESKDKLGINNVFDSYLLYRLSIPSWLIEFKVKLVINNVFDSYIDFLFPHSSFESRQSKPVILHLLSLWSLILAFNVLRFMCGWVFSKRGKMMQVERKGNNRFMVYGINVLSLENYGILICLTVILDFILVVFLRVVYLRI